jgi:hypothetical protein
LTQLGSDLKLSESIAIAKREAGVGVEGKQVSKAS